MEYYRSANLMRNLQRSGRRMIKKIELKISKRTIILITLFIIALLSIFVVSKIVTAPSFNAATVKSLDDKKVVVMKLAAVAAASSTAISLIPGDAAIPASIHISDLIYSSYQASIEQTVETVKQNEEYIEVKKKDLSEEDKDRINKIGKYVSNFTSKIGKSISEMTKKGEDTLSRFLDAIAVLIITSCVIPMVVILIFAWTIKILFGLSMSTEHLQKTAAKTLPVTSLKISKPQKLQR
jgi:hypothetical protein